MAKSLSAKKRIRQNLKRRARNRVVKTAVKTAQKKVLAALEQGDRQGVAGSWKAAVKALDQATAKGIMHRRTAARRKSQLIRKVNALVQPGSTPAATAEPPAASESE